MAVTRGILLGAANVLVIAIGLGVMEHESEVTTFVIMFGGVPGLIAGGVLGGLAKLLEARPPPLRAALLAVPAVFVVFALAAVFEMRAVVPIACIPTFVAVLVLERGTRRVIPPPVPVATARSMRT